MWNLERIVGGFAIRTRCIYTDDIFMEWYLRNGDRLSLFRWLHIETRDPSFSKHPASLRVPCAASSCSFISSYRSPLETSARRKWTAKFIIIFTCAWGTACCTASRSRM